MTSPNAAKPNQIGLVLAVAIGLASMLGAGVFAVFHEADAITSQHSDHWALLIAIGLAGLVATLNAASVYQLARSVPRAGGVYAYSRVYVNDTTSFVAGFSFIFGKIGSISAIGLVFGIYVWPDQPVLAASLAIAVLTVINLLGINRTAQVALVLSITTVAFLVATIVWGFTHGVEALPASGVAVPTSSGGAAGHITLDPQLFVQHPQHTHDLNKVLSFIQNGGIMAILSAAAIVFFAFAGYARVATLGDEVRNPQRNIPRAIAIALTTVVVLYFALAIMFQQELGQALAYTAAPFATFWQNSTISFGWPPAVMQTVVVVIASGASLGSILALLAGVSRTAATMAEDRELIGWFRLRNRRGAPWLAEVVIAAGAIGFAQLGHLDWSIGFSSLSVLLYYGIGHVAALRQLEAAKVGAGANQTTPNPTTPNQAPTQISRGAHLTRAATAWVGMALCALLLVAVPGPAVWLSTLILAGAMFVRRTLRKRP